eukprot:TRINITY_DN15996_c0_g1_i2.p1 TRINITY_DN15996_c0_g1~~TRINITY_DN15996_c0_g1_i2.p1  ORF type:complete len:126 (-),score=11.04 TRINITY_DN15996_c0_g1_i2:377-754(-)
MGHPSELTMENCQSVDLGPTNTKLPFKLNGAPPIKTPGRQKSTHLAQKGKSVFLPPGRKKPFCYPNTIPHWLCVFSDHSGELAELYVVKHTFTVSLADIRLQGSSLSVFVLHPFPLCIIAFQAQD